jgi:hypothetical protein
VDLLATDPYPFYGAEPTGGYPLSKVADWTKAARAAVQESRPVMTVLQFFQGTSNSRWPTQQELRNMSYMAIAEGANGLMYWSVGAGALAYVCSGWCEEKNEYFERLKAVVTEIKGLETALSGEDRPELLAASSNPAVHTRVKYAGGVAHLIASNSGATTAGGMFTLSQIPSSVTLYGETDIAQAAGPTITDQLGPYAARVYRIVLP